MMLETDSFLYFFIACKWRFKFMHKQKLEKLQLKKAQAIVDFAYNNSNYFYNHFKGHNLKDVWNLPITNKKLMMENLSDYNTLKLVHSEHNPFVKQLMAQGAPILDLFYYQGLVGPIKIWEVNYPDDIIAREEFLRTSGKYAEFDNLKFTK